MCEKRKTKVKRKDPTLCPFLVQFVLKSAGQFRGWIWLELWKFCRFSTISCVFAWCRVMWSYEIIVRAEVCWVMGGMEICVCECCEWNSCRFVWKSRALGGEIGVFVNLWICVMPKYATSIAIECKILPTARTLISLSGGTPDMVGPKPTCRVVLDVRHHLPSNYARISCKAKSQLCAAGYLVAPSLGELERHVPNSWLDWAHKGSLCVNISENNARNTKFWCRSAPSRAELGFSAFT